MTVPDKSTTPRTHTLQERAYLEGPARPSRASIPIPTSGAAADSYPKLRRTCSSTTYRRLGRTAPLANTPTFYQHADFADLPAPRSNEWSPTTEPADAPHPLQKTPPHLPEGHHDSHRTRILQKQFCTTLRAPSTDAVNHEQAFAPSAAGQGRLGAGFDALDELLVGDVVLADPVGL